jgi:hypothetical protein
VGYGDPQEGVAGLSGASEGPREGRESSTGGSKGWEGTASEGTGSKRLASLSAAIADLFSLKYCQEFRLLKNMSIDFSIFGLLASPEF